MSFFDLDWKKLLARSPAYFQENADVWLVLIEDAVAKHKLEVRADLFRTTVLAHLAIEDSEKRPANWSTDALDFVKLQLATSSQMLSKPQQTAAFQTANILRHVGGSPA